MSQKVDAFLNGSKLEAELVSLPQTFEESEVSSNSSVMWQFTFGVGLGIFATLLLKR